jgi:DNA invertase Pin-like site-specific DNA recombinase
MSASSSNGNEKALIRAVGYLRKSTRGERKGAKGERRQKQEKSIPQQKEEILRLARGRYEIVKWFEDEGISGWKRGAKRPDFQRMINEAQGLGAHAILCDHIDRFSRATYADVLDDVRELGKAGVRWIVTASNGEFDLGHRNDIAEIIKFAAAVWSAHEYCRNLGRRIARARRDMAEEGKRTGGAAPYGLANDGEGGLRHGDPQEVEILRWLFDQFGNELRSLCCLAGDLNARKVPPPRGKRWYPKSIGDLLRQRAYRGDFTFNVGRRGQFFGIDAEGEVVETAELNGTPGKLFVTEGAYAPLIEPTLFDKVQHRLDLLKQDRGRRKRQGYALTGVLVCDNCGSGMYGTQVLRKRGKRSPTVYRCNANSRYGRGVCRQYQIRERDILPFVLRMLGEQITDIKAMLTLPPEELRSPNKERTERRAQAQLEREQLAAQIARAEQNLLSCEDPRTLKSLNARVTEMRDQLDRLDVELSTESENKGYTREDLEALTAWWDNFEATALSLPVPSEVNLAAAGGLCQDPFAEESAILVDPRKVNEALLSLGAEVRLHFKPGTQLTRAGTERPSHELDYGRFRLGQQQGALPGHVVALTASPSIPAASATCAAPCLTWPGLTASISPSARRSGRRGASTSCAPPTANTSAMGRKSISSPSAK